jgi:alkylation response protein AidB-like acyl-CoA dehydrogenase
MILGADALVEWCSSMLDQGYRGELECIVAKIFGSESLKETAVDLALKTHGGRSFLKGHIVGDNIHDLLAPCIYEGEGEMLAMAFFKGLVKDHGNKFMGPIAKQLSNHKIKKFNPANPSHAWKLRKELTALTAWIVAAELNRSDKQRVAGMPANLQRHIDFATANFRRLKRTVNYAMLKHQMKLADRQLTMVALSMDVQRTVTMLAACMYAAKRGDEASILAADVLCQDLSRKIKPSVEPESYFRDVTRLGKLVGEGKFAQIDDTMEHAVLKPYVDNAQRAS